MIEIVEQETLEGKIRKIAEHYSRRNQWQQAIEEARELLKELETPPIHLSMKIWSICRIILGQRLQMS